MRQGFHHRLLNSLFEDPCLFVRIPWEKQALIFDLGDIRKLALADLYKVSHVFVTHMHVDHFIGFDQLLRVSLRRHTPLHIYGPPGIITCVQGKLRGYTWNLITEYPAVIAVHAFSGRKITSAVFRAENRFRKEDVTVETSDGTLLKESLFSVTAIVVDHGTPCLAYALQEEVHININRDLLLKRGLSVGPWLSVLKKHLRDHAAPETVIDINGTQHCVREVSDLAILTRGQKISYVTDMAMTAQNIRKVVGFVRDSDVLYAEAYFMEKDRERALSRRHITARTAGLIARQARAQKLVVMHFSPKYSDTPEEVIDEAIEAFNEKPD